MTTVKLPRCLSLNFPALAAPLARGDRLLLHAVCKSGMFPTTRFPVDPASCSSGDTLIDCDARVLLYRCYPIEQLAQHCYFFLEWCYLLLRRLPHRKQENEFVGSPAITPWCL